MSKGPPKKEIYNRLDFKPEAVDFELYSKFQNLLSYSEMIRVLKTEPKNLAVRVDDTIAGGLMGGSAKHVGLYSPHLGQPTGFFILYNKGDRNAVQIYDIESLKGAEALFLDNKGSPRWSDVFAHPDDYDWQKLIKQ